MQYYVQTGPKSIQQNPINRSPDDIDRSPVQQQQHDQEQPNYITSTTDLGTQELQ
jgi:hypothetical protein